MKAKSSNAEAKSSGGCYVATAVYGSYDCPQVWTLRRYRDYTPQKHGMAERLSIPITQLAPPLLHGLEIPNGLRRCGKAVWTVW